jgi:glycosyltransferase involved in cell wall biosynthesis
MSLVSIIIPTYNRGHLISETLDSILAQSYTNWECIIVDDRSSDNTDEIILQYINKDNRFKYFKRPKEKHKGANVCRNIGLNNFEGDYVVFFDSDDLMTSDHLEIKIESIKESQCDYVITRTQYFNQDNFQIDKYYQGYKSYKITPFNYITQKINWLTLDVCLKRDIALSINFNEQLQSGQEYNYYSKLVHKSVNTVFIDKVLSLRRAHDDSIRSQLKTKTQIQESYFNKMWFTYLDVKMYANKETRQFLMKQSVQLVFQSKHTFSISFSKFFLALYKEMGMKSFYLPLYFLSIKFFGKGYYFIAKFNQDKNTNSSNRSYE